MNLKYIVLYHLLILVLTSLITCTTNQQLSCLNENGDPVDYWISLTQNSNYNYYVHHDLDGFIKSVYHTNQTINGCIMETMNQLYNDNLNMSNIAYVLYNDEPPPDKSESSTYAHSKGVILTNDQRGFFLVHSKPNWPNARIDGPIGFPDTTYAQSLLCMTLNSSQFDAISLLQMVNYPYIYDKYISTNLQSLLPNLNQWINKGKSTNLNETAFLTSSQGKQFIEFGKSKAWGKDLYEDYVAYTLNDSLSVETWRSGSGGRMGSFCENANDDTWLEHPTKYNVYEVSVVTMPDGSTWKGTQDHSKWVSGVNKAWVCIGDINRMCSQEARGGGTVCVHNESLWSSFQNAITSTESCWGYNPCTGTSTKCYWCESHEPTTRPTSLRPTTEPTIQPTASYFSVVPSILSTLVDFQATQILYGINLTTYNAKNIDNLYDSTIKQALADCFADDVVDIEDIVSYNVTSDDNSLYSLKVAFGLELTQQLQVSLEYEIKIYNSESDYTKLSNQLKASIENLDFNRLLTEQSSITNAYDLSTCTSNAVTIVNLSNTDDEDPRDSNDDDGKLSSGLLAGIIILSLVCFIVIIICFYYIYTSNYNSKTMQLCSKQANSTTTSYSNEDIFITNTNPIITLTSTINNKDIASEKYDSKMIEAH